MRKQSLASFSLVEVTLALGVAAFCLIAVFGLMPVGVQTNRNAASQTAATNIMAAVVADLRATPKGVNTSVQFAITFGTAKTLYFDGAGQASTSLQPNSRYQINVTWNASPPAGMQWANVKATWPPTVVQTSPTPVPSGSTEMFVAFDRNP
ncbi:MAG TPA: Verru_Chthon cassette protein B [Candidatus Acidoferrales bacterium]|jgi:uncharacterized protein (TIGR02598 family)|nr:Verru_Chthon cassette protein B [Candidatus Acidoferrales bacterium]